MIRYILSSFVLVVLTIVLMPPTVNASSVYDNIVQPATSFTVTNSSGTKTTDITNYAYYIAELCPSTTNTLFLNAVANDHYRSIVAIDETNFGSSQYAIEFFFETTSPGSTPDYDTEWQDGSSSYALIQRTNSSLLQFSIHYNYPADELACTVTSESSSNNIYLASTYDGVALRRPILNTYPITYPDDYDGIQIPEGLIEKSIKRPDFSYDVASKKIRLTDLSQALDDPPDYKIYYQITIGEIEDPEGISLLTGYANPGGVTEFDIGRYTNITIQATYAANNGDSLEDTDTVDYRDTIVSLNIDGSAFSGSTTDSTCDENDVCAPVEQSPYEDCSTYGTDMFGFIGCIFGNFQKWVIWLIVPDVGRISAHLDQMTDKFRNSLGILWTPFDFIISTFQLFAGTVVNPTGYYCNIGNLSMFGSPAAPMEICRWRDQFPQLWSLMQSAIQAGLGIGFIFAAWNMFKVHVLRTERSEDGEPPSASGVTVTRVRHK